MKFLDSLYQPALTGETMELEEIDVDELLESLYQKKNNDTAIPKCIPSVIYYFNLLEKDDM